MANPVPTHPPYRSLPLLKGEEGHRGFEVALARDFNPDTGNVPDGLYEVVNVREGSPEIPFTTTEN